MDNFNIEITTVEKSEIDYSMDLQELIDWFDEKSEEIHSGKATGTLEIAMLGYAIDFLFWTKEATNVLLDFEEGVICAFESILDAIYRLYAEKGTTNEEFQSMLKMASGFLCIVIAKNIPCELINSNIGWGVRINGTDAFVMNRIGRRLQNGREEEVVSFYNALKSL